MDQSICIKSVQDEHARPGVCTVPSIFSQRVRRRRRPGVLGGRGREGDFFFLTPDGGRNAPIAPSRVPYYPTDPGVASKRPKTATEHILFGAYCLCCLLATFEYLPVLEGPASPLQTKSAGLPGITRQRVGLPLKIFD